MNKINKMNKKGFIFAITGMMILAVVIAVSLIGFFFFQNIRFTLIGVAIMVGTFVFAVPPALEGELTNRKIWFIVILFLIGGFFIILPYTGLLSQTSFQSGHFEAPFFATIQCSPAGGVIDKFLGNIPESGDKILQCPINTKTCDVWINEDSDTTIYQRRFAFYKLCDRDGINCESTERKAEIFQSVTFGQTPSNYLFEIWDDLPTEKSLKVRIQECIYGLCSDDENLDWHSDAMFEPYTLWIQDSLQGGLNKMPGSIDCKVPTYKESWKERIISTTLSNADTTFKTSEGINNQLATNEAFNYISGTVTRALDGNSINYKGELAYCIDNIQGTAKANIYEIGTLETASNKYNVVNLDNLLGQEDCCINGAIQLNRKCVDFTWKTITIDEEGNTDIPCPGGIIYCGVLGRLTHIEERQSFEWACVDGFCKVDDIRQEDCTENKHCGSNQICVNFKCEKISTGDIGGAPEPKTAEDCEQENSGTSQRFQWIQKSSEECGFLCKVGIGQPKVTDESFCKDTYLIPMVIGIIAVVIVIIVGLFLTLGKKPKKGKKGKKRKGGIKQ